MNLDLQNTLAIGGIILGVGGLVYAVVVARRNDRRKVLTYDVAPAVPLASILPDRSGHKLSIVFEREGFPPINVKGAYLRFVQIGNLGRDPIRSDEIAPSDPLLLQVRGATVLDLAVANVSREVINFRLGSGLDEVSNAVATEISFDFLDYQDGAILRVLADSPQAKVRVSGTIIGMPNGIYRMDELGANTILNAIGCILAIVLQISVIAGALNLFRTVTGGGWSWWLFLLPLGAIFLPAILVSIVASLLWPKGPQWPKALKLPKWFISWYPPDREVYRYRGLREDLTLLEEDMASLESIKEDISTRGISNKDGS